MRELATERLLAAPGASLEEWVALNGGVPDAPPLRWQSTPVGPARPGRSIVTFDSEMGLTIPGILDVPSGPARARSCSSPTAESWHRGRWSSPTRS